MHAHPGRNAWHIHKHLGLLTIHCCAIILLVPYCLTCYLYLYYWSPILKLVVGNGGESDLGNILCWGSRLSIIYFPLCIKLL